MKVRLTLLCAVMLTACATSDFTYKTVDVPPSATTVPGEELLTKGVQRIAFGSCSKQQLPQPLWKRIAADRPDLFLWTGDVIYADTKNMAKLSTLYRSEQTQAEYSQFLATKIPMIGVYDDHDYGENDSGREYAMKDASKDLFLDFIGEAKDSPRRKRDGVYTSYAFGSGEKQLKVILLDTRYNREKAGKSADLLGANQWAWLENELKTSTAKLNVVVSSIQVLSKDHAFEKWANFPEARERLLKLLAKSKNVLIISGDRHIAEISRELIDGREIFDVTSSGMTHSFQNPDEARNKNSLRVGTAFDRLNYGLLTLDWQKKGALIEIRNVNQETVLSQGVLLR
jgi:alkaline phosphatase D